MGFRIEEVPKAPGEGRSGCDEELRRKVQEQAQLLRKGENPIAQALHLGRQALLAVVQGREREACRLLLEAVRCLLWPKGEVLEVKLWRWADLTPEAFLEHYHKASYTPKEGLAAWIEAGVRRGRLDLEAWQPVLEILGSP